MLKMSGFRVSPPPPYIKLWRRLTPFVIFKKQSIFVYLFIVQVEHYNVGKTPDSFPCIQKHLMQFLKMGSIPCLVQFHSYRSKTLQIIINYLHFYLGIIVQSDTTSYFVKIYNCYFAGSAELTFYRIWPTDPHVKMVADPDPKP